MAKKKSKFALNRKEYDRIRKMDHFQMTLWAESIYESGVKDGAKAAMKDALDISKVEGILLRTKGFGKKKVTEVCKALEEGLKFKDSDGTDDEK